MDPTTPTPQPQFQVSLLDGARKFINSLEADVKSEIYSDMRAASITKDPHLFKKISPTIWEFRTNMKQLNNDMKVWTLDECINESVGATGTPERERFEAQVAQKVERSQRKSVHITIPVSIYDKAISRANAFGESMSMYISNLLSQDARCIV